MDFKGKLVFLLGGDPGDSSADPPVAPTESDPALGDSALQMILDEALVPDSHGRWVTDPEYVESHDMNRAAARGWRAKAANVAADYSITIEGRGLNRDEMMQNFLKMAEEFDRKAGPRSARADGGMDPFFLWSRGR